MRHARVLSIDVISEIRRQFRLDEAGHHGFPHWARVYRHGLYVGRAVGADLRVIELFAFLHDSQRRNENKDPDHGLRAAEYAQWLHRQGRFELEKSALELLVTACEGHSNGYLQADPTVMACWDADRLDLGRVGTYPDPRRLCTEAARDATYIERAWRRGQVHARRLEGQTQANRFRDDVRSPWFTDEDGIVHLDEF